MESASAHFFSQRDLLVLVANHLITPNTEPDSEHQKQPPHKKDLARLCRTSRFLYRVCTPVLWRDIDLATFLPTTKMEKFVQQWRQLVTKGVLVRSLKIRKAFLVLHMSNTCVQSPSSTDSINNNQQLPSAIRPNWAG
ncbi:hypothetical protein EC991_005630 [Linnemannia zychae]|nr:hypothetical protein EC991_005630 [Linnemannia zychae]